MCKCAAPTRRELSELMEEAEILRGEKSRLTADLARVTQERDELRRFKDDVVTAWHDEFSDQLDDSPERIASILAKRAAAIRERSKP